MIVVHPAGERFDPCGEAFGELQVVHRPAAADANQQRLAVGGQELRAVLVSLERSTCGELVEEKLVQPQRIFQQHLQRRGRGSRGGDRRLVAAKLLEHRLARQPSFRCLERLVVEIKQPGRHEHLLEELALL